MKKLFAVFTVASMAFIGTTLLFGQQRPSALSPVNRYSTQVVFLGIAGGLSITDHVENKQYFYVEKEDNSLELRSTVDLTKAGQQRIESLPTTRPAKGG